VKQILLFFKKIIFSKSNLDEHNQRIEAVEKQIAQIKLQLKHLKSIEVEKIVIEKIICDKIETNYHVDSISTENLSGTMNVGTIFPGSGTERVFNQKKNLCNSPAPESQRLL